MGHPKGAPPSPWEATAADEPTAVDDPVKLLGELLLGRAGAHDGAIESREIRWASGLVLGGVCLGLAGFGAIALGQVQATEAGTLGLRELGGVLGGAGLLMLLWGILAGLPGHRSLRAMGLGGILIGVLGLAAFAWAYPQHWGRFGAVDHTVPVLATYVAGLVILVAATFGGLVADFVLRMQAKGRLRSELGREPTDEEIQRDIDDAWRRHKVTWGGMAPVEGRGIKVQVEAVPSEWTLMMPRLGREVEAKGERAVAVSDAVDALVAFRGGRNRTGAMPEAGVGDAAATLAALRQARAEAPKPSWLDRLLGRVPRHAPPPGFAPGAPPGAARPPR